MGKIVLIIHPMISSHTVLVDYRMSVTLSTFADYYFNKSLILYYCYRPIYVWSNVFSVFTMKYIFAISLCIIFICFSKMWISSRMVFISNLLLFSIALRLCLDWWQSLCLFVYRGLKNLYGMLFQAEVIEIRCKWYLGLDFHSRLLLLRVKKPTPLSSHLPGRQSISLSRSPECRTRLLMHWSKSASVRNLSRLQLSFMWLNS